MARSSLAVQIRLLLKDRENKKGNTLNTAPIQNTKKYDFIYEYRAHQEISLASSDNVSFNFQ